ncbi:MAG: DUF1488 domain-containing protein [Dongiaceae bacterium]
MTLGTTLSMRQRQTNRTRARKSAMLRRMALSFPNPSRSYDATRHGVRFWAYDEALEVPFFVEGDALCRIDPKVPQNEAGYLNAFDRHRDRIFLAANRNYRRHSRGSYTLAAADLRS